VNEPTEANENMIRALLVEALDRSAGKMGADSIARSGTLAEGDLKAHFKQALRDAGSEQGVDAQVAPIEHAVRFAEWPGVGGVDVALTIAGSISRPVFFELKWGTGTLYNCIWDAPKMALAAALGACDRAYLVAGAPVTDWSQADGANLFADGTWTSGDQFTEHKKHWDKWARDVKTRPLKVPATFDTQLVATSPVSISDDPWELRAVEVAPSVGWFEVIQVPMRP
jgi:hypothetical protein